MTKVLQWLGLVPSADEQKILDRLSRRGSASMKVTGRGTLTKSVKDARSTPEAREFVRKMNGG